MNGVSVFVTLAALAGKTLKTRLFVCFFGLGLIRVYKQASEGVHESLGLA